jgi:hypothetical protein
MAEQKIELRKIRDFGENLSDTFLFIKQNFKSLLKCFFAICGMFMIAHAIFNGIYQSHAFGIFDQFRRGVITRQNDFTQVFTPEYFLTIFLALLSYTSMRVVLGSYIKFYAENDHQTPTIADVWNIFRKYFFKILLYNIPIFILIVIGTCLCIAPGVWLAVVFVPFDIILMMEDASFGDAFNRSFAIVKENFWMSCGIYIVAGLIYLFSSSIVGVVVGIIVGILAFFSTNSIGTTMGIVTSLLNVFSGVFYTVFFVSAALNYFNLVEKHDGTGILQRVENMGTAKNDFDNIQENY